MYFQKLVVTPVKKEFGPAFKEKQELVLEALEVGQRIYNCSSIDFISPAVYLVKVQDKIQLFVTFFGRNIKSPAMCRIVAQSWGQIKRYISSVSVVSFPHTIFMVIITIFCSKVSRMPV